MRLHALLPALGIGLALLGGCSRDTGPASENTTTPVDASQVKLVDPASLLAKTPGIDDGMGYTDEFSHQFVVDANAGVGFADGFLEFTADGGAVDHAVAIEAEWLGADGYYGYDFGPDGLQFADGVEMAYAVDGILEAGLLDEGQQLILYWDLENGTYQEIPSELVVHNGKAELKATIHHFTKYVIGVGPPPGGGGGDGGGGVN